MSAHLPSAAEDQPEPVVSDSTDPVATVLAAVRSRRGQLITVTGAAGSGISTVLHAVSAKLTEHRVLLVRLDRQDAAAPFAALYRMLAQLGNSTAAGEEPPVAQAGLLAAVARLADAHRPSGQELAQISAAVLDLVQANRPLTLVLDGAQWLDEATVALVPELFDARSGARDAGLTVLAGLTAGRVPQDGPWLRAERVLTERLQVSAIRLRPLSRASSTALIERLSQARPDPALSLELHRRAAGNPGALSSIVRLGQASAAFRVVDRHLHRNRVVEFPMLPADHPCLAAANYGVHRWSVTCVFAVLHPLGEPAAGLTADWLKLEEELVRAELDTLVRVRILVRTGNGWRFRSPVVAAAAREGLGPYAKQRLAAIAVEAIWQDGVSVADPTYLPDQLAVAGRLIDPERSAKELMASGGEVLITDGEHATRWLGTVPDLVGDPAERAIALLLAASACAVHDRMADAATYARQALRGYIAQLPAETMQSLHIIYVTAVFGTEAGPAALTELVEHGSWATTDPGIDVVTRGFALMQLGRWREGFVLLRDQQPIWRAGGPTTVDFGEVFFGGAGMVLGELAPLREITTRVGTWRTQEVSHRMEFNRIELSLLLQVGDRVQAEDVLVRTGLPIEQVHPSALAELFYLRGDWDESMATTRRALADDAHTARALAPVTMVKAGMEILLATGWVDRSRQLAEAATGYQLVYCLGDPQAASLQALGEPEQAAELLADRLGRAEQDGMQLCTEVMWGHLARLRLDLGQHEAAEECVRRCATLAERLGTGRARLAHLVARAVVHGDHEAGVEAVVLARRRGIPFEQAMVFSQIGGSGQNSKVLLREAYDLLGTLGARLWRARLRRTMREHSVPVPARALAVQEDDQLLAILVTEGLRNRQLAAVFGGSEKSIEGKLSRLFARSGYQSRVDLAVAVLSGEFGVQ